MRREAACASHRAAGRRTLLLDNWFSHKLVEKHTCVILIGKLLGLVVSGLLGIGKLEPGQERNSLGHVGLAHSV